MKWFKSITWRDMAWFSLGLAMGILLICNWLYWGTYHLIDQIPVNAIHIDFNETEMINAMIDRMNESGQLIK